MTLELIVSYNAQALNYTDGPAMDVFEREPRPDHAMYVASETFGTELGTIIATYETDDPETLVRRIKESYGSAISYVEEGGEKHALEPDDSVEESGGERDPEGTAGDL